MKILIVAATHGNETIGLKVIDMLKELNFKKNSVSFLVANKLALKKGLRCIDEDLNRAFPGDMNGNYEQRLAAKILEKTNKVDVVIDIHSTTSQLKDAVIVTKFNKETLQCLDIIGAKHILKMSATKDCALISSAPVGIAFEYGKDADIQAIKKTYEGIKNVLEYYNVLEHQTKLKKHYISNLKTDLYDVYKSIPKKEGYVLCKHIKNYKLVKSKEVFATKDNFEFKAQQDFYPILFGQKNYEKIFGFAARKIENKKILKKYLT